MNDAQQKEAFDILSHVEIYHEFCEGRKKDKDGLTESCNCCGHYLDCDGKCEGCKMEKRLSKLMKELRKKRIT